MLSYIISTILARRTRSFVTMLGVALGVVLVLLTTGLARGQLAERGRREANAGAEIIVRPAGSGLTAIGTVLSLPPSVAEAAKVVEGVEQVVPVGVATQQAGGGFGWRSIDGIDFDSYARISGLSIARGRAPAGPREAIVDEIFARDNKGDIGKTVDFGGTQYAIVGVYAPESLSRIKIPLTSMQEYYDAHGNVSMLLIKVAQGADVETVATRLRQALPEGQILLARDLPNYYAKGIPALHTFLNVVVGLAVIISTLVTMLTMYTSVMERTRQIGILKSLGASRPLIASLVASEALVITVVGVVAGFAIAAIASYGIVNFAHLGVDFEPTVFVRTALMAVAGGALGALYPAFRAAGMDPVEALAYE
jgi:putative ABC transport system permease protein